MCTISINKLERVWPTLQNLDLCLIETNLLSNILYFPCTQFALIEATNADRLILAALVKFCLDAPLPTAKPSICCPVSPLG